MSQIKGTVRKGIRNSASQDSAAKLMFGNARLCSQFLRDYSGIDLLKDVSEDDIEDVTTRYIPMFTEERDSDVVKRVRLRNDKGVDGCVYMIALIEHKSEVDYNVTMQVLRYMVYIWEDYEKEQEALHSGISKTKGFKYPPILPIVYYERAGRWTAVTSFKDRVFLSDIFKEYVPDYSYKLIRLKRYSDEELIEKNDMVSFLMLINKLRNSTQFEELVDEFPDGYLDGLNEASTADVLDIVARIVGVMLRKRQVEEERIADFTDRIKERGMGEMFADWDSGPDLELIEQGREEGKKEGRCLNVINAVVKKMRKGKTPSVIADELEEDKAMISAIYQIAERFAPEYDTDAIYKEYAKLTDSQEM